MEMKDEIPQKKRHQVTPINQDFSVNTPIEKSSRWDIIASRLNENKKTITIAIAVIILLMMLGIGSYHFLKSTQNKPLENISDQKTAPTIQYPQEEHDNKSTSPTPVIEPQSTPTPTPLLIEFGLYGSDYSDGIGTNYVTSVEISLYGKDGAFISKKTSPATVEPVQNNIGQMPSAVFFVPPGTYNFQGVTSTLIGKGEITLPSDQGPQYRSIVMYIKPSKITGKLFVDNNNNGLYDSGDEVLDNKNINAYYFTSQGKALEANSTTTNSSGDYSITIDKYSGTYQLQTDLNLPYMYPKFSQIQVGSEQQLNQNIYLLPR